jgi:tetratricopeptide (TPR) repeat protein
LSRDPHHHLSPDELASLVEVESVPEDDVLRSDRTQAERHAESCELCGSRLRDQRSVQSRLRNMVASLPSKRKPDYPPADCPSEEKWMRLAAGLVSSQDATLLLEHATHCDHCGPALKSAIQDFNPELSEDEEKTIRQLASADSNWQHNIAQKMSAISEGTKPERQLFQPQKPSVFANWMRWAIPLGAAAAIAVGAGIIWDYSSPSLASTNKLIAQAFTEQRPFELRFPGAGYGPVRQERGVNGPSRSRMDEPAELLEAETQIERALKKHPDDPGWLQAKARADLFEGNYQRAIEGLQEAEIARPESLSLKGDLAIAYCERAELQTDEVSQIADYSLALQILNGQLANRPDDLAALYNRALVHQRLHQSGEAAKDWQRYLQLEPRGEWAARVKEEIDKNGGE